MGEAFSTCRDRREIYRLLVGKPNGKSLLLKLRRRWDDKIKIDLQ